MSDLSAIFREGAKVVISPDKMRAWVSLPPPAKGAPYTAAAIAEWLPQNGVVFGADDEMIRQAVESERYDELLEVARGTTPVAAAGGDYVLKVEQKPFTGLRAAGDGALIYDDFSFLQEVEPGQVLAEVVPPTPAVPGTTVTGEVLQPREGGEGRVLQGSGFEVTDDGRYYRAPVLAHVNIVNEQLVVTPLLKLDSLSAEDGEVSFDGNVFVAGDVTGGASLTATGSVFVAGRAVSASIKAGNNLLLAQGMRNEGAYGTAEAKENVWGLFFEFATVKAGGDICANHLAGCEATAGGRANILGGRGSVASTNLYAKNGVVAAQLGDTTGTETVVRAGLDKEFLGRYESVTKRSERVTQDIQALQQNITAHERVNRMKADKGRQDAAYKEMVKRRDAQLGLLNILEGERTRLKRTMDQASTTSINVRDVALPGVEIIIDTRSMKILEPMRRVKFRRVQESIEAIIAGK